MPSIEGSCWKRACQRGSDHRREQCRRIEGTYRRPATLDCEDPCDQVDGTATEGAPEIPVPAVHASDYFDWADYILNADGTMTDPSGTGPLCTGTARRRAITGTGTRLREPGRSTATRATAGTYYVEGHATVSGSPGSTKNPAEISIIAEGSIQISGSPKLAPDTSGAAVRHRSGFEDHRHDRRRGRGCARSKDRCWSGVRRDPRQRVARRSAACGGSGRGRPGDEQLNRRQRGDYLHRWTAAAVSSP